MNRVLFVGCCALAALASGCGKTPLRPPPQDQPQCDAGKLDSAGLCVECTGNADCAVGQACNLITGTCQPVTPPEFDAGGPGTCQLGAVRCAPDGKAVQDCVQGDGGNDWTNATVCTGSEVCNPQTLTCAICIPGETACDSSDATAAYQRCKDDGTGWDPRDCTDPDAGGIGPDAFCHQITPHQDLSDGGEPISGLATCRLCQPGSAACTTGADGGAGVLRCDSTGSVQTFSSCYPTNTCIADDGPAHCKEFICYPGQSRCAYPDGGGEPSNTGSARQTCNADFTGFVQADCTGGQVCGQSNTQQGVCLSACDVADNSTSYVGCDYWGTLMSNTALGSHFTSEGGVSEYAFVVGNPSTQTANVSVQSMGNNQTYSATVAPNSVASIKLPWLQICGTGQAKYGYHLTSDQPVTVYQFNPLSSAIPTSTSCSSDLQCSFSATDPQFCKNGKCQHGAFTDDASLLLPSHLLGTSYVVVSQDHESSGGSPLPGAFSVVALGNDTRVQIHFAGGAVGSGAGANAGLCTGTQGSIPLINPGQTLQFSMAQGDVLEFWSNSVGTQTCASNSQGSQSCLFGNDLTGSVVTSIPGSDGTSKKIAVFGGADCTFKPFNKYACDHIEEEMFPFNTWGKTYVGAKSKSYSGAGSYSDFWRIVSGCGPTSCPNGTTVTITPAIKANSARPASACGANCTCTTTGSVTTCHLPALGSGDTAPWIEFEHTGSFSAQSDQPLVLAQYLVGEEQAGSNATEGDPSLVLAPPVEQWRTNYNVLAPTSYQHNFANLMVQGQTSTTQITVDGTTVPANEWVQVPNAQGGTTQPYYVAQHALSNSGSGSHAIVGNNGTKVGVVVYGYDSYVSYGYTGGLDLQSITQFNPGG